MSYPIIGISGAARCGKDTLCRGLIREFEKIGIKAVRKSIAGDTVKNDLKTILFEKIQFDTFTEDHKEKESVRPLLVEYGKIMRQKTNGRYFIDQFKLEENCVNIIPDIRYAEYPKDELFWLKNEMKGLSIFIEREEIFDANETEKINNKLIKEITDFNLKWGRLNENSEYERKIIDFHSKNIIEKFYLPLTNRTVRSF
jgi:hypothetical protein